MALLLDAAHLHRSVSAKRFKTRGLESNSASLHVQQLCWMSEKPSILRTCFEINFGASHKFGLSKVQILSKFVFGSKTALELQSRGRFEDAMFSFFRTRAKLGNFRHAGVPIFGSNCLFCSKNGLAAAVQTFLGCFGAFLLAHPFRASCFHFAPPHSLFRCFVVLFLV